MNENNNNHENSQDSISPPQVKNENNKEKVKKSCIPRREQIILAAYISILVVVIVSERFYNDPLFAESLQFIHYLQGSMTKAGINFFHYMTYFGVGIIGSIIFFIYFNLYPREKAFYVLFVYAIENFLNQSMKTIYKDPRPFFINPNDIQSIGECSKSYGNPSGHVAFAGSFYVTLFLMFFHDNDYLMQKRLAYEYDPRNSQDSIVREEGVKMFKIEQRWTLKRKITYWICLVLLVFVISCTGFSRMVLGQHSINQVIYGTCFGLWLAFFLYRYARPQINKHIRVLLECQKSKEFSLHSYASIRNSTLFYIIAALSIWLALILLSVINFLIASKFFEYDDHWILSIIEKCGGETNLYPNDLMNNSSFIKTGLIANIFGAYFGIVIDSMYFNGTKQEINDTKLVKFIARVMISGLIVCPLTIPYFLLSTKYNVMTLYLCKTTLPFFFIQFILFGVMKIILRKFKVINMDD